MKVLIITCILVSIIGSSCGFEISKIQGIKGEVIGLIFDSDSNALVIARDSVSFGLQRVYKLDAQKNILATIEVTDTITQIWVNNKNDFYIITWRPNLNDFTLVNIIRAGSSEMERIQYIVNLEDVYADDYGNLIYNTDSGTGVYYLKYNTSTPVLIKNLENFAISFEGPVVTDYNGNTYAGGYVWDTVNQEIANHQLVVIPAVSEEEIPEGKIIEGLLDNPDIDHVDRLSVNSNNEILISITDDETTGSLKKLSDDGLTTIFTNERYQNYFTKTGKTRSVITACDYIEYVCRLSYMTLDDEIVQISNLQNQSSVAGRYKIEIDDDGSIFIAGFNTVVDSTVEFLNFTDSSTVGVDFGDGEEKNVDDIRLDGNGNLWVLSDAVYFIEKGTLEPVQVSDSRELLSVTLDVNENTNEVFVGTVDGLYVISH